MKKLFKSSFVFCCLLLLTLLETYFPQSTSNWTAYNDLAWGSGQLTANITKITSPTGGSGLPSTWNLVNYINNELASVVLTVSGGSYNGISQASQGRRMAVLDATIFNGIISTQGTITSSSGDLVLTLSNMNSEKSYNLVFYSDRDDYGWNRASLVTISSTDGFTNASSSGTDNNGDPLFSGPTDVSTRLPADNDSGFVARFFNVRSGSDGSVVLTISDNGTESNGKYASALMVQEFGGGTINLQSPGDGSILKSTSANLEVRLTDFVSQPCSVEFYIKESGAPFTLIHMGDSQIYTDTTNSWKGAPSPYGGTPEMFDQQTEWIVNSKALRNIVYVAHVGDIVENNNYVNKNGTVYENYPEWDYAKTAMYKLDAAGIPYGIAPGGHDIGDGSGNDSTAKIYNEYFGVAHFDNPEHSYWQGNYPDHVDNHDNRNHYDFFEAGGMKFVVVYLEMDNHQTKMVNNEEHKRPYDEAIGWADGIIKANPDKRAIVVSHLIVSPTNEFIWWGTDPNPDVHTDDDYTGQRIFDGLKYNDNLFLMLSGHVRGNAIVGYGEFSVLDALGSNNHKIQALCADYQDRFYWTGSGLGLLRIMQFDPSNNTIYVQTYSPVTDSWERDGNSEFTLSYNMDGTGSFPPVPDHQQSNIYNGGTATYPYSTSTIDGNIYHWYAKVIDNSGEARFSPVWKFSTAPAPLPIELSIFNAFVQGQNVNLAWTTITEVNSYGFEVERKLGGRGREDGGWEKIGFVQGSGNSSSPKEYSFIDKKLNGGKYNYRLKMIDTDGTFEYSDVVEAEIELPKDYAISQNYPNPFNPTTRIDYQLPFDSKVTIELYGITGEKVTTLINEELAAGYYTADVNASNLSLASGVYICRMVAQDQSTQNAKTFVQIKKLMLLK